MYNAPHHGFVFGDQPFHHCRYNLFDDTGAPVWRLNLHKSNAANERLADGLFYGREWSLGNDIRPRHSHSNSFGNDAEKDTAGCRALTRKYIVIGEYTRQDVIEENRMCSVKQKDFG